MLLFKITWDNLFTQIKQTRTIRQIIILKNISKKRNNAYSIKIPQPTNQWKIGEMA